MQLLINTPAGQTVSINTTQTNISSLKSEINTKLNIPTSNQILTFAGKLLTEENCFEHYNISNYSRINLSLRMCGGTITETDNAALIQKLNKTICRVCYATNSPRATNCRKKNKCGGSTKLRPKRNKRSTKKTS